MGLIFRRSEGGTFQHLFVKRQRCFWVRYTRYLRVCVYCGCVFILAAFTHTPTPPPQKNPNPTPNPTTQASRRQRQGAAVPTRSWCWEGPARPASGWWRRCWRRGARWSWHPGPRGRRRGCSALPPRGFSSCRYICYGGVSTLELRSNMRGEKCFLGQPRRRFRAAKRRRSHKYRCSWGGGCLCLSFEGGAPHTSQS